MAKDILNQRSEKGVTKEQKLKKDYTEQKTREKCFRTELIRRRNMTSEALAQERFNNFLKDHKNLILSVQNVLYRHFNALPKEKLEHESAQIVGCFQDILEYGAFCRRGEYPSKNRRGFLSGERIKRKDLESILSCLQKVHANMRRLFNDPGAWDELQRRLWRLIDGKEAKITRPDLFLLQILSYQELLKEIVEDMINEGTLFERDKLALKKARRIIIQRLAFLFELSKNPDATPHILKTLKNCLDTMTGSYDLGCGKKTNQGNIFIKIVQEVFKALGYENKPSNSSISQVSKTHETHDTIDTYVITGKTICEDVKDSIKELSEIPNNINREESHKN